MIDDLFTPPPANLPVSQTDNPYWDILRTVPGDAIHWKYGHRWAPDSTALLLSERRLSRHDLCGKYAWAIPDPAALAFVAEHCSPRAIEIGAGTGYWAWQLSQLGVDIVVYDKAPPQLVTSNHWHSPRDDKRGKLSGETRTVFFAVRKGTHTVLAKHTDRTLFLCWTPYNTNMAFDCLKNYQGKRLVFIGESEGGCTGDDAFFELLDKEWEEIASHQIVQWSGLHDSIAVYERKEVLV